MTDPPQQWRTCRFAEAVAAMSRGEIVRHEVEDTIYEYRMLLGSCLEFRLPNLKVMDSWTLSNEIDRPNATWRRPIDTPKDEAPEPGEGWRYLTEGESRQPGDEWRKKNDHSSWSTIPGMPCGIYSGSDLYSNYYRRRIEAEKPNNCECQDCSLAGHYTEPAEPQPFHHDGGGERKAEPAPVEDESWRKLKGLIIDDDGVVRLDTEQANLAVRWPTVDDKWGCNNALTATGHNTSDELIRRYQSRQKPKLPTVKAPEGWEFARNSYSDLCLKCKKDGVLIALKPDFIPHYRALLEWHDKISGVEVVEFEAAIELGGHIAYIELPHDDGLKGIKSGEVVHVTLRRKEADGG